MVARQIGLMTMATAAAPEYLKKHGIPQTLDDLQHHFGVNYVSASTGRVRLWEFQVEGVVHAVQMKSVIAVNDAGSYIHCGVAGLGLVKSSRHLLNPYFASGQLVEVLRTYRSSSRPMSILYAPNRHLTRKVRIFIDWLAAVVTRYPCLQGQD